VARTTRAIRVLETAHPPSFYLPWRDVARTLFREAPGGGFYGGWITPELVGPFKGAPGSGGW
jgi:Domain of unknown function (DUF427)